MTGDSDRRGRIAGAAVEIVAEQGTRALTHRAVDRRLALPAGSTSFYARTRRALLAAAVQELAARARREFAGSGMVPPGDATVDVDVAAAGIAGFLDRMLSRHRADLVARYALALEVTDDEELRGLLANATFSQPLAETLMRSLGVPDPAAAAADLISLAEGLLLDRVIGRRALVRAPASAAARRRELQAPIGHYLRGLSVVGATR